MTTGHTTGRCTLTVGLALLACAAAHSQQPATFTPEQLRQDVTAIEAAIERTHPDIAHSVDPAVLSRAIEDVRANTQTLLARKLLTSPGCGAPGSSLSGELCDDLRAQAAMAGARVGDQLILFAVTALGDDAFGGAIRAQYRGAKRPSSEAPKG